MIAATPHSLVGSFPPRQKGPPAIIWLLSDGVGGSIPQRSLNRSRTAVQKWTPKEDLGVPAFTPPSKLFYGKWGHLPIWKAPMWSAPSRFPEVPQHRCLQRPEGSLGRKWGRRGSPAAPGKNATPPSPSQAGPEPEPVAISTISTQGAGTIRSRKADQEKKHHQKQNHSSKVGKPEWVGDLHPSTPGSLGRQPTQEMILGGISTEALMNTVLSRT